MSRSVGELSKHNPLNNSYSSNTVKMLNDSVSAPRAELQPSSQSRSNQKTLSTRSKKTVSGVGSRPKVPRPPLNRQSSEINLRKEQAIAEVLFSKLDSDNDGIISADCICIDSVPGTYLKLLLPLLTELEELNQTLNFEEFAIALQSLVKTFTPQDRAFFLCGPKKTLVDPNLTFHPQINDLSREMSKNLRPYGTSAIYDHYINEKKVISPLASTL